MLNKSILTIRDFSGGFQTTDSIALNLADNQSPDVLNCHSNIHKSLQKRLGFDTKLNSSAYTGLGGGMYHYVQSTTVQYLEQFVGGVLMKMDMGTTWDGTWDTIAVDGANGTQLSDSIMHFTTWSGDGTLIMTTEARDVPQRFNSSDADYVNLHYDGSGTAPSGKYCIVWFNHTWVLNTAADPDILQRSTVNSYKSWDGVDSGSNSIVTGGDIGLTGVAELNGLLYVFKKWSIHRISYLGGSPLLDIKQVKSGVGTASMKSIINVQMPTGQEVLMFLGTDKHIYIFDGWNCTPLTQGIYNSNGISNVYMSNISNLQLNRVHAVNYRDLNLALFFVPLASSYDIDVYDKLLLHCDGINGSTTFIDNAKNKTVTNSTNFRSNADIDDEDMAAIADWTLAANVPTQVTFDSKSCMKLDTGASTGVNSSATQDIGTFGNRTVISMNLYFDAIGTLANTDYFRVVANKGDWGFYAHFASDGLYLNVAGSYVEVGTNLVVQDAWQEWTFDINWTAHTVDIYLDSVLKQADYSFGEFDDTANGTITFIQYNTTTANRITYIDWFTAGTLSNAVVVDTSVKVFGTGSAWFKGAGYLSLADSVDWYDATGNFSKELWVSFKQIATQQVLMGQYEDSDNYWFLQITSANKLQMKFVDGGVSKGDYIMASAWSGLAVDVLHHVEFTRNSTAGLIFIDGVSQTLTETTAFSTNDVGNMAAALIIGCQNSASYFYGHMDEIKLSKGIARHTAGFTPLTKPYGAGPTHCIVYDYVNKSFWPWDNCNFQGSCLADDGTGQRKIYVQALSYAYEFLSGNNDDGTDINAYWTSKKFDIGNIAQIKHAYHTEVITNNAVFGLAFQQRKNWETSWSASKTLTTNQEKHVFSTDRILNNIQYKFTDNSSAAVSEVLRLDLSEEVIGVGKG